MSNFGLCLCIWKTKYLYVRLFHVIMLNVCYLHPVHMHTLFLWGNRKHICLLHEILHSCYSLITGWCHSEYVVTYIAKTWTFKKYIFFNKMQKVFIIMRRTPSKQQFFFKRNEFSVHPYQFNYIFLNKYVCWSDWHYKTVS